MIDEFCSVAARGFQRILRMHRFLYRLKSTFLIIIFHLTVFEYLRFAQFQQFSKDSAFSLWAKDTGFKQSTLRGRDFNNARAAEGFWSRGRKMGKLRGAGIAGKGSVTRRHNVCCTQGRHTVLQKGKCVVT